MREFSGVSRFVWIPVLLGLAATTLTGCKKTTHAAKPLANISQAVVASPSPSTAAPAPSASASAASASPAPVTAGSLSASSASATPTVAVAAGAGCARVSAATVAQLLGVGSVTTVVHATAPKAPVIAHEGCQYRTGTTATAGFDINTFSGGLQVPAVVAQEMSRIPGIKSVTIDGNPGFSVVIAGTEEEASFTKGQRDVVVLTNGKAGAAVALATLIGNQL